MRSRSFSCSGFWLLVGCLLLIGLLALAPGCDQGPGESPPPRPKDPLFSRLSDEGELGRISYQRYCSGCHGEKGDGNGPAAAFLFPRPRDFTLSKSNFKFGSTPAGALPLDEDLLRTITYGLAGTAMPGWKFLSTAEREALVRYLKTFSQKWVDFPPSKSITFHPNPFSMDPQDDSDRKRAIALGEEIYHGKAGCWACHLSYVDASRLKEISAKLNKPLIRVNFSSVELKADSWDQIIPPPEFKTMKLKSVRGLQDLYRVIASGVGGTAMPTWDGSLNGEELWALTLYVNALIEQGKSERWASLVQATKKENVKNKR